MEVKNKSLALKVERALKQISQDFQGEDDENSEDQEKKGPYRVANDNVSSPPRSKERLLLLE